MIENQSQNAPLQGAAMTERPLAQSPGRRDVGGAIILTFAFGSVAVALIAALGAGWGLWAFAPALQIVIAAGVISIVTVVTAFALLSRRRRKGGAGPWRLIAPGIVIAILFSLYFLRFIWLALTLPAIHDVSTDLADPPVFVTLPLRADNDIAVPGAEDSAMRGMTPRQRWAQIHQDEYDDLRSLRVAATPALTMARLEAIVRDRGWEIAAIDAGAGRIEATDTSTFFRFKDDIVIRVRPASNSSSSIVDVRSVSRVGSHDFGVNANRVRALLADIPASQPQSR